MTQEALKSLHILQKEQGVQLRIGTRYVLIYHGSRQKYVMSHLIRSKTKWVERIYANVEGRPEHQVLSWPLRQVCLLFFYLEDCLLLLTLFCLLYLNHLQIIGRISMSESIPLYHLALEETFLLKGHILYFLNWESYLRC